MSEDFERAQRFALEFGGYLLTEGAKPFFQKLSHNNRAQAETLLSEQVSRWRVDLSQAGHLLAPELEALLTSEAVIRLRREIEKFLRYFLSDLRIHDIRSEVLASWLAETETSNSSSVGVDNSASEVATPARTKIIIPWQRLECMEGTGDGIVIVLKGAVA